jgi:acyl carrier protein
MISAPTEEQILNDVSGILRNFNGREYDGDITMQTKFVDDLGLASIDALVLAETLEEYYGRHFPFQNALADRRDVKITDVVVGDLVAFLHRELQNPPSSVEDDR